MQWCLYESDFISLVFQQAVVHRFTWLLSHFISVRHKMAVAFLASQVSKSTYSLILGDSRVKIILFLQNYCKLLVGVSLGKHETAYPLGLRWRWRHKDYKNL